MSDALNDREYERRFLITEQQILKGADYQRIRQGYLWTGSGYAIRIRLIESPEGPAEPQALLTLKGPREQFHRYEVETPIDSFHARAIVDSCPHVIVKRRYGVISENDLWVIDVFEGANAGLVIAEYEGSQAAVALVRKPWWAGDEVTNERRYDNESLAIHPIGKVES